MYGYLGKALLERRNTGKKRVLRSGKSLRSKNLNLAMTSRIEIMGTDGREEGALETSEIGGTRW